MRNNQKITLKKLSQDNHMTLTMEGTYLHDPMINDIINIVM